MIPIAVIVPPQVLTSATSGWLGVVVLTALAAVTVFGVRYVRGRRDKPVLALEERQQKIFVAVTVWSTAGWQVVEETDDSAVISRDDDRVLIAVDRRGRVKSNSLPRRTAARGA